MIKKTLIIATIALLFCSIIASSAIGADRSEIKTTDSDGDLLSVEWFEPSEPINFEETKEYEIDITYNFNISEEGFFKNLAYPLFKDKAVSIKVEILEKSEWCTASLDKQTIETTVGAEEKDFSVTLSIGVKESAPAYAGGFVKLNISVEAIKGPLGFITYIGSFLKEVTVDFTPAYLGLIDVEAPQEDSIKIAPYNETLIPINISNIGNGPTKVLIDIVNSSDSFELSISDSITIDVNKTKTVNLMIDADHKFDQEEIIIELKPVSSTDPEDEGSVTTLTLLIENDGSYVEEDEPLEIDITILIVILVIIVLALVAYKMIRRKYS